MGSSTIQWNLRPVVKYHLRRGVGFMKFLENGSRPQPPTSRVNYVLSFEDMHTHTHRHTERYRDIERLRHKHTHIHRHTHIHLHNTPVVLWACKSSSRHLCKLCFMIWGHAHTHIHSERDRAIERLRHKHTHTHIHRHTHILDTTRQ